MFHADTVGANAILEAVRRLRGTHGAALKPAPLLERLAREGRGFHEG